MTHRSEPLRWLLPAASVTDVDPVCREARMWLAGRGLSPLGYTIDLLLREFLNNAILHGHRARGEGTVRASLRVGRRWVVVQVADEGPGFDWRRARRQVPDETAVSGRGLAIGRRYAGRMRFNRAGNQVTLWVAKAAGPKGDEA